MQIPDLKPIQSVWWMDKLKKGLGKVDKWQKMLNLWKHASSCDMKLNFLNGPFWTMTPLDGVWIYAWLAKDFRCRIQFASIFELQPDSWSLPSKTLTFQVVAAALVEGGPMSGEIALMVFRSLKIPIIVSWCVWAPFVEIFFKRSFFEKLMWGNDH